MKRCLSLLITLAMLLACAPVIPLQADAAVAASGTCGKSATWTLDDEGTLTISGTGAVGFYEKRESPWYSYKGEIAEIVVEDTITDLSKGLFYGCSMVDSVTIPFTGDGRKTATDTYQYPFGYIFGSDLFDGSVRTTQKYIGSNINTTTSTDYYIPKSLKTVTVTDCDIPKYAFYNCSNLESIIIGNGVTSIGLDAFNNCSWLKSIVIPDSVTRIYDGLLEGCGKLESITIPFVGEYNTLPSDTYQRPFGWIFGTFSYSGGVATKQEYIGSSTSSTIEKTFYIPSSLKSVTVTGGNIPYGAFRNCTNLTSVSIGKDVTSIGEFAFYQCENLTDMHITDIAAWCNISFGSNPLKYAENLYLNGNLVTDLVIPDGVTAISGAAFQYYSKLTSVTIPDSVTSIGGWAFSYCNNLSYVDIPDSVTDIGEGAFAGCAGLKGIDLPDNIEYISRSMLSGCTSLKSVIIPENVTDINTWAFNQCTNLTSLLVLADSCSFYWDLFAECSNLTSVYCAGKEGAYGILDGNDPLLAATWYYETIPCLYIAEGRTEMLYSTVEECLTEADRGTIKLLTDSTAGAIVLKPGVTLDLNDYALTANLFIAMDGAKVTDGGEDCVGGGCLKIAKGNLALAEDNGGVIPVWNGTDGYIFTKATFQQLARPLGNGAAQYIFLPSFSNAEAAALLADGGADNGLKIKVSLNWGNGQSQQFYTYSDELVKKVFDGTGSLAFDLSVTGISGITDMTAQAVVVTDTGAQATNVSIPIVAG